ncbi:hypothetical protein [Mesobacillus zeae]|uniref:Uncharacterized protein n=1 Tax=Mesobacillus zeae TaxID=1917180 RepID=A0A398BJA1_9BACI|nr:hypothetical protein [Mesobacillus zeae]RID87526.1 hypothetical protein D1970_04985 [Mesobacillus zeae]
MHWETLPGWIWAIYYTFLLITLGASIFSVLRKRMVLMSVVAIVICLSVPVVGFINSIGRGEGTDELEYLVSCLQEGSVWAVFILLGISFLFLWWFIFFSKVRDRAAG